MTSTPVRNGPGTWRSVAGVLALVLAGTLGFLAAKVLDNASRLDSRTSVIAANTAAIAAHEKRLRGVEQTIVRLGERQKASSKR